MIRESLENKRIQMGIIITLLAIGFAAVATNLFINGTAKIGFSELDVYYSRAVINGEEDNSVITSRRVIEFETPVMTTLGEKYTLEYDVTNGSKNYDAKLQMNCTSDGNEFVSIKNTFNLDDLLKARTTRSGVLVIKLIKPSTEDRTFNIQCQIDAEPIEREEPGGDEIVKEPKTLVETIMSKANDDSINDYDAGDKGEVYAFQHEETAQLKANTDYRFIGDVPNNYIRFNEEDWRVIGVFEDEDGIKRAKIIKDTPTSYFSTSNPPTHVIDSELKDTLDNLYNDEIYYNQVDRVNYYLGVNSDQPSSAEDYYNYERNTQIATGNNKYKLSIKVGLMYISDYYYTYAYGVDDTCASNVNNCGKETDSLTSNSWLYKKDNMWTIDYYPTSNVPTMLITSNGTLSANTGTNNVYPVVYLDEDIIHSDGDGTKEHPYIIESSKNNVPDNKPTTSDNNLVNLVMSKKNNKNAEYNRETKKEVFTFEHEATEQQNANTDYRFIGNNPNNYIIYDNDVFRIIGIFEDENGVKRAKIVRDNYARTVDDTSFKWNDSNYTQADATKPSNLINSTNWGDSDLYNSYTRRVLSEGALEHADKVKWYLGASDSLTKSTTEYYKDERSNNVYSNNDKYINAQVGILNVSDYFYTYANGVNDRCFNTPSQCATPPYNQDSSWLYKGSSEHFLNTMSNSQSVFILMTYGSSALTNQGVTSSSYIRDVVYLKPDTVSLKGDGSKENPYTIESHDSTDYVTSFKNESLVKSDDIEKLVFVDSTEVPKNAIVSWDASAAKNGSIMEYTLDEDNNGKYELYIGKVGKVYTQHYTQNLFSFSNATKIENIEKFSTKNVKNMYNMFWGSGFIELDLSHFDTSAVQTFNNMFSQSKKLVSVKLENWDTKNVADMTSMFNSCQSLKKLDLSKWNTLNLQKMYSMFEYCYEIEDINLHGWKTDKVTQMRQLFNYCKKLKELDISTFNTSLVFDMSYMFEECEELVNLDLGHFDTSHVNNTYAMFYNCYKLHNLNLSSFDLSNVQNSKYMFLRCYDLTATLNIKNTFTVSRTFINVATNEGAQLTLNYTNSTESFVDSIIANKDSDMDSHGTSNIVKGNLIA